MELFWTQLEYRVNSTLSENVSVKLETIGVFNKDLTKVFIFLLLNGDVKKTDAISIPRSQIFETLEKDLGKVKNYLMILIESYRLMDKNLLLEKLNPIMDLEIVFKIVVSLINSDTHENRQEELNRIREYVGNL